MKLSEAVVLGSTLFPQGIGHIISSYMNRVSVCALGAALAAHGDVGVDEFGDIFLPEYPLVRLGTHYPFLAKTNLCEKVMTLNDNCNLSLTEIADYIRLEEEKNPHWYSNEENKENNGGALQAEQLERELVSG